MSDSLRILVLGGTSFIGRAIVERAVARDADITLFTRGKTEAELFPQVTRLTGDRDGAGYAALAAYRGDWDAVVDTTGYLPRHVVQAMDVLGDRAGRYLFLSSHAVYQVEGVGPGSTEDTPRRAPVRDVTATAELTDATYGPSKVACEDDVTARYGDRAVIVRPGKVAGPHDNQRGLTYYVRRAARGGRLALPGDPEQPVQLVDSRDLAALVIRLLEDGRHGAFTRSGPSRPSPSAASSARVRGPRARRRRRRSCPSSRTPCRASSPWSVPLPSGPPSSAARPVPGPRACPRLPLS
jgi:2'-hydroxyisoflavone reductase